MIGRTHSAAQRALIATADAYGLVPFDIRVLVALHELGGTATTDELEAEMCEGGTMLRRSSLTLRTRGLILADAGPGTRQTRRGTRARYRLTANGSQIAMAALARARRLIDDQPAVAA